MDITLWNAAMVSGSNMKLGIKFDISANQCEYTSAHQWIFVSVCACSVQSPNEGHLNKEGHVNTELYSTVQCTKSTHILILCTQAMHKFSAQKKQRTEMYTHSVENFSKYEQCTYSVHKVSAKI